MQIALGELYRAFSSYRLGNDFTGCNCCVADADCIALRSKPLRDLTYSDLERYSGKAISTWGNARHFKYFLPRLFELTIDHRDDFLDLTVVFRKLTYARWHAWPEPERAAVNRFFCDYWRCQLAQPIDEPFNDGVDTVLCAIAAAYTTIQAFLLAWLETESADAQRHLAAFILTNESRLLNDGKLANSFWDTKGTPHSEVICWLQSPAALNYLARDAERVLTGDFALALPQLMAIRASLVGGG